jgi:hypothetical protein
MKPESDYYVEVVIKPADGGLESFRAVMVTGTSPKTAEKRAIEDARQAHPEGMEFSTFMTRKVTAKKADEIMEQMGDGTWSGWFEQNRSRDLRYS